MQRLGTIVGLVVMGGLMAGTVTEGQRPPRALPVQARVYVGHTGHDAVGDQVAFSLREAIRGSEGYALVESGAPSDYVIELITVPNNCGFNDNVSSAISVIVFADRRFVTAYVYSVGSSKAPTLGRTILASFDEQITDTKRQIAR